MDVIVVEDNMGLLLSELAPRSGLWRGGFFVGAMREYGLVWVENRRFDWYDLDMMWSEDLCGFFSDRGFVAAFFVALRGGDMAGGDMFCRSLVSSLDGSGIDRDRLLAACRVRLVRLQNRFSYGVGWRPPREWFWFCGSMSELRRREDGLVVDRFFADIGGVVR